MRRRAVLVQHWDGAHASADLGRELTFPEPTTIETDVDEP
jgi:hypothetical protein